MRGRVLAIRGLRLIRSTRIKSRQYNDFVAEEEMDADGIDGVVGVGGCKELGDGEVERKVSSTRPKVGSTAFHFHSNHFLAEDVFSPAQRADSLRSLPSIASYPPPPCHPTKTMVMHHRSLPMTMSMITSHTPHSLDLLKHHLGSQSRPHTDPQECPSPPLRTHSNKCKKLTVEDVKLAALSLMFDELSPL
jgi:hypothetical protein